MLIFFYSKYVFIKGRMHFLFLSNKSEVSHNTFAADAAFIWGVTPHKILTTFIFVAHLDFQAVKLKKHKNKSQ